MVQRNRIHQLPWQRTVTMSLHRHLKRFVEERWHELLGARANRRNTQPQQPGKLWHNFFRELNAIAMSLCTSFPTTYFFLHSQANDHLYERPQRASKMVSFCLLLMLLKRSSLCHSSARRQSRKRRAEAGRCSSTGGYNSDKDTDIMPRCLLLQHANTQLYFLSCSDYRWEWSDQAGRLLDLARCGHFQVQGDLHFHRKCST